MYREDVRWDRRGEYETLRLKGWKRDEKWGREIG